MTGMPRASPALIVFVSMSLSAYPTIAPFADGKFLLTPLSRLSGHERYTASLSVRRGRGSQTQDSVYTFKPEFACRHSALAYAAQQGRDWLRGANTLA